MKPAMSFSRQPVRPLFYEELRYLIREVSAYTRIMLTFAGFSIETFSIRLDKGLFKREYRGGQGYNKHNTRGTEWP